MSAENRDPYGKALSAVRGFTHEGRFAWGEAIVVKDIAEEIGLSPTPVREALACLAGEGLIERRQGKGYFYPALSGPDIIDLYDLEWSYVHAALTLHPPGPTFLQKLASQARSIGISDLFRLIVGQTGNESLIGAFDRVHERLLGARRAETALGRVFLPGARDLAEALAGDPREALAVIEAHQRQRCACASETARFLQRQAGRKA